MIAASPTRRIGLATLAGACFLALTVPLHRGAAAAVPLALSPDRGPVGAKVEIAGEGLTGSTGVRFGGVPAAFAVRSDTSITATVPPRALTGLVKVDTPAGTVASATPFRVLPTIVFVLTDDQRWDTLKWMPTVTHSLVDRGVRFANAFASNPLCCPSRASFLTGRYSHDTGVWGNLPPHGGVTSFPDATTIATVLDDAGYRTGLFGKYLNGYTATAGTYVPPGWDRWRVFVERPSYYRYALTLDGGATEPHGTMPRDYSTDVLARHAAGFIRSASSQDPLFVMFTPFAPHSPFTPAPRHDGMFDGVAKWRPRSYDEADVSDKPRYVASRDRLSDAKKVELDEARRDQLAALRSVDEAVARLRDALADTRRLSDTIFVFASDNGLLWGEHRLEGKDAPYEESIRIPMVVRWDRLPSTPRATGKLVLNLDLPVTLAQAAGVTLPGAEGASLMPLLRGTGSTWRTRALLEHVEGQRVPSYCGIRSPDAVFVHYATGEEEYYRLDVDPDQGVNRIGSARWASHIKELRITARERCRPRPPGMVAF